MIGVVGPGADATRLAEVIEASEAAENVEGAEVLTGEVEDVVAADPDVVVAVGAAAVRALVRAGVRVPVLVVDAGEGLDSFELERVPAAVERGVEAGFDTRKRPVLEVAVDGDAVGRGAFDATLVTSEPARISEYAVETPGGTDRFRADGVVISTPAGSHGYARTVGGPVLDPDTESLAIVPVAAFAIRSPVRVAAAGAEISVRVERDEGDIALLVDGETRRRVPPKRPVTVEVADVVETVIPPSG